jgi:hypothetical protein
MQEDAMSQRPRIRVASTILANQDANEDWESRKIPAPNGKGFVVPSKKGEKRGGRTKGTPNKTTKLLKEAILMAAELEGSDGKGKDQLVGYLRRLAKNYPKTFSVLLGRVLPLQITGKVEGELTIARKARTVEEVRAELQERGLPVERIFH